MAGERDAIQGVEVDRKLEELSRRLGVVEQRLGIVARAGEAPESREAVRPPVLEESRVVSVEELVRKRREMEAERERAEQERMRSERERLERARLADAARLVAAVETPARPPTAPRPVVAPPVVQAAHHECVDEPVVIESPVFPRVIAPPVVGVAEVAPLAGKPPVAPGPVGHRPMASGASAKQKYVGFENLIGGKLYAAAGAILLVIGVGMLLKLGLDRGWFSMPPAFKCLAVAALGLGMVGLGEVFRKRWGAMASMGVSAAGIAVTFAAVYASHGWYQLIGAPTAFALMALTSAMGVGVALRAKSIAVAALALIAAYITPVIVRSSGASPLVMPIYLSALLGLGLVLSAWRPDPFRMLRQFTWWGTVVMGSLWLVNTDGAHPWPALVFLGVTWCAVHASLWFGARRLNESAAIAWAPSSVQRRVTRPIVLSFATTAWTVTSGVLVVQSAAHGIALEAWMVPGAGVVGTLALAMALAGNLRIFRDAPETDAERLGASLWMQSGAMLIATVAMGVSDWTQVIAWLGMGVAAAAVGRWLRARSLDVYALIVLSIAVVRLLVWESWQAGGMMGRGAPMTETVLGLALGRWSVLMASGGAAWLAVAWLMHRPSAEGGEVSKRRSVGIDVCIGIGLSVMYGGVLSPGARGWAMLGAAGVLALAMLWAGRWRRSMVLDIWGVLVLAGAKAIGALLQLSGTGDVVTTIGPIAVTTWGWTLVWLGGAWMIGAWLVRAREAMEQGRRSCADVFIGLGLTAVYMSVLSVESAATALAIGAGVLALAVMTAARVRRAAMLEWWAMAVLVGASVFGVYAQLGGWEHTTRSIGAVVFTNFSLVMVCLGGAWIVVMSLMRRPSPGEAGSDTARTVRNVCLAIALPMLYLSIVSQEAAGTVMVGGAALLGAALVVAARVRRSTVLEIWGGTVLTVATGLAVRMQFVSVDGWRTQVGSVVVSSWSLVLIGLAAAWLVGVWAFSAFKRVEDWAASVGAIIAATLALMVAALAQGSSLGWACVMWTTLGMVLVASHVRCAKYRVDQIGLGVLASAAGLWAYRFVVSERWFASEAGALMHPGLWIAIGVSGVMLGAAWWLWGGTPRRASWGVSVIATAVLAGAVLFGATSLEVGRSAGVWAPHDKTAQAAAVSIWWAVFAVGLLVVGFAMRLPLVRHAGLGLLFVAALKTMVYDLGQGGVAQEWRVASVIGLGAVMLGVSVVYAKVSKSLERREGAVG